MKKQKKIMINGDYRELDQYFLTHKIGSIFLVCGESLWAMPLGNYFANMESRLQIRTTVFSNFVPNPKYSSVVKGVELFGESKADAIVAVGGGSAMDVAKCVKLFAYMDNQVDFLKQEVIPNSIPLVAIPTTAGTGSEATKFSVIYQNGEKQSIADDSCIPHVVVFDPSVLRTLPLYQRKVTMLDALCHGIESFWSLRSTNESKEYAKRAIQAILYYRESYLNNEEHGNLKMLEAANLAGRAINISQTTAGHAMSYKLTSLYGIAHGHAVALCLEKLWSYMVYHMDQCIDPRGTKYLKQTFSEIADAMGCSDIKMACRKFSQMLEDLHLSKPYIHEDDYMVLKSSVNSTRLKNNPIRLEEMAIDQLYHEILET